MHIKQGKRAYSDKKVNRETIDLILEDIKNGCPRKHAAESNLISEGHFYDLIKQGLSDIDNGIFDTLHSYLAESLRKIEKNEIISCRKDIRKYKKGHKGAEWTLEKVYWRYFCGDAKLMELAQEIEREKQQSKGDDNVSKRKKSEE